MAGEASSEASQQVSPPFAGQLGGLYHVADDRLVSRWIHNLVKMRRRPSSRNPAARSPGLQLVYAVARDRNEVDSLSDDALAEIDEAVTALQKLLSP